MQDDQGYLKTKKTVIIIKPKNISKSSFLDIVSLYRIKFPSHFGFMIHDPIGRRYIKIDPIWTNFERFFDDLSRMVTYESSVMVAMSIFDKKETAANTYINQRRIILINTPTLSLVSANSSLAEDSRKLLALSGLIVYKGIIYGATEFLDRLQKEKLLDSFNSNPVEFCLDKENGVTLKPKTNIVIFNPLPKEGEGQFSYITASGDRKDGLLQLSNGIIINDIYPSVPAMNPASLSITDEPDSVNSVAGFRASNLNLSPRQVYAHIIEEFTTYDFSEKAIQLTISAIMKLNRADAAANLSLNDAHSCGMSEEDELNYNGMFGHMVGD